MSINPVPGIEPVRDTRSPEDSVRPAPMPASGRETKESTPPDPGNLPKREIRISHSTSESAEIPRDEVEVQRDSATAEIVIKYLDHAGNVILQVPNSQMLAVARAIDQDFQKMEKDRGSTDRDPAAGGGGKVHGH